MSKLWTGITAGVLAGAAGATAKNAVSYVDQAVVGEAPPSAPGSPAVAHAAGAVTQAAGADAHGSRETALGSLGGLAIGLGVGAVAGAVRGSNATPNPVVAAVLTGAAAMALGDGAAAASGSRKVRSSSGLVRDLVSHLAYGAVTGWALHLMVDPRTSTIARLNPFGD